MIPEEQIKQIVQYFRIMGMSVYNDVSFKSIIINERDISKYFYASATYQ